MTMIPRSTVWVSGKGASRQDERRRAIVAAARKAFLRNGYGATSMSAIAADLGGSKTTLWRYFRNKQDLFAAVIDAMVERYGEALGMILPDDGDPAEVLRQLGGSIMRTVTRPQIIALHRLVTAEAARSSHLGRMLWERGAARGQQHAADWLARQMDRGVLRRTDPFLAARHFIGLCQSGSFYRQLMGAGPRPSEVEIEFEVNEAVSAFLRAYRA